MPGPPAAARRVVIGRGVLDPLGSQVPVGAIHVTHDQGPPCWNHRSGRRDSGRNGPTAGRPVLPELEPLVSQALPGHSHPQPEDPSGAGRCSRWPAPGSTPSSRRRGPADRSRWRSGHGVRRRAPDAAARGVAPVRVARTTRAPSRAASPRLLAGQRRRPPLGRVLGSVPRRLGQRRHRSRSRR